MSLTEWRQTATGWWVRRGEPATFSRWRRARKFYLCDDCRRGITKGQQYVVSAAAPWHDVLTIERWYQHRLCSGHPEWAPPIELAA